MIPSTTVNRKGYLLIGLYSIDSLFQLHFHRFNINMNRLISFKQNKSGYTPSRLLEGINRAIKNLEAEFLVMVKERMG